MARRTDADLDDEPEAAAEPTSRHRKMRNGEHQQRPYETARAWVLRLAASKLEYVSTVANESRAAYRRELAELAELPKQTFGARVRALRPRTGLTQAGLAEKSGVPLLALREIETDVREPDAVELLKLARALDVGLEAFDNVARGQRRLVLVKGNGMGVGAASEG